MNRPEAPTAIIFCSSRPDTYFQGLADCGAQRTQGSSRRSIRPKQFRWPKSGSRKATGESNLQHPGRDKLSSQKADTLPLDALTELPRLNLPSAEHGLQSIATPSRPSILLDRDRMTFRRASVKVLPSSRQEQIVSWERKLLFANEQLSLPGDNIAALLRSAAVSFSELFADCEQFGSIQNAIVISIECREQPIPQERWHFAPL